MKLKEWLDEWGMKSLKIKTSFLEMEWAPNDVDRDAAWELYIELLTRISTQTLIPENGDEQATLTSIYKLFDLTREIIRRKGRHSINFTKIAVIVLNQVIRPFTARWHKLASEDAFKDEEQRKLFRKELASVQVTLRTYTRMLADMADVEDLTEVDNA